MTTISSPLCDLVREGKKPDLYSNINESSYRDGKIVPPYYYINPFNRFGKSIYYESKDKAHHDIELARALQQYLKLEKLLKV